jgi:undecaprenyl-diphosphatase
VLGWLGSHSGLVLFAVLLVVSGIWGFIELLDEVREGETQEFDEWAVRTLTLYHGERYKILEEIGRDVTALGGIAALALLTAFVVGYLIMVRNYPAMWLVLSATVGGLILSSVLKTVIDRPRPDLGAQLSHVYTQSFPSGHSMMSAVVYLTLGALLARLVQSRVLKFYFVGAALIVTFLVGISRVYMGVHWPTDVLAGWTAGLVWAILCWLVATWLQRHGALETQAAETFTEDDVTD